jgi:hypothetical protein
MVGVLMQQQKRKNEKVSDLPTEQAIRKLFHKSVVAKVKEAAHQGKAKRTK